SRRWRRQRPGAHCLVKNHPEYNDAGIGICLVGHFEADEPTPKQWETVLRLTAFLRKQYDIPLENVLGHGEVKNTACPGRNFNFARFIDALRKRALRGRRAGR
ncbi:MAG: peptidoglycan recognition family protein, partial [Planctomycetia bacterium]|nr:peptidoglycan recognition family protein [Planctomycetia bacterium]